MASEGFNANRIVMTDRNRSAVFDLSNLPLIGEFRRDGMRIFNRKGFIRLFVNQNDFDVRGELGMLRLLGERCAG